MHNIGITKNYFQIFVKFFKKDSYNIGWPLLKLFYNFSPIFQLRFSNRVSITLTRVIFQFLNNFIIGLLNRGRGTLSQIIFWFFLKFIYSSHATVIYITVTLTRVISNFFDKLESHSIWQWIVTLILKKNWKITCI